MTGKMPNNDELQKQLHSLDLAQAKLSGDVNVLKTRVESELGHLRREVGEALEKLDRNTTLANDVVALEGKISSSQEKLDQAVEKLDKQAKLNERVIRLEEKESARDGRDKKRDAGLLATATVVGAAIVKSFVDWIKGG